jgi:hypothetical protein
MATQATRNPFTDSTLPLYRLDAGTYSRLVDAGALEGLDVELLDGVLVNRHPHGSDSIHRIDVGTYERMVATGALEGLPIELLEGLLVEVSPQGAPHAAAIVYLTRHLVTADAPLRVQLPLETEWGAMPEPDLALVEAFHPRHRHPRTALLAVEVAVSSHEKGPRDQGRHVCMGTSAHLLDRRRPCEGGRGAHGAGPEGLRSLRDLRPRHQGPIAGGGRGRPRRE